LSRPPRIVWLDTEERGSSADVPTAPSGDARVAAVTMNVSKLPTNSFAPIKLVTLRSNFVDILITSNAQYSCLVLLENTHDESKLNLRPGFLNAG
jgi:hypothetical protein